MLGLKLNHVSKRGHRRQAITWTNADPNLWLSSIWDQYGTLALKNMNDYPVSVLNISIFRVNNVTWERHRITRSVSMMTSSNGNVFRVTGHSPATDEIPSQRPVTRSFDVFFDLRLNKRLSKQSKHWWFETPSRSLWRHCNVSITMTSYGRYGVSNHQQLRHSFKSLSDRQQGKPRASGTLWGESFGHRWLPITKGQ